VRLSQPPTCCCFKVFREPLCNCTVASRVSWTDRAYLCFKRHKSISGITTSNGLFGGYVISTFMCNTMLCNMFMIILFFNDTEMWRFYYKVCNTDINLASRNAQSKGSVPGGCKCSIPSCNVKSWGRTGCELACWSSFGAICLLLLKGFSTYAAEVWLPYGAGWQSIYRVFPGMLRFFFSSSVVSILWYEFNSLHHKVTLSRFASV
jgi:hypothetical protein